MIRLTGVTVMEDRAAEFTVRVILPEIFPEVAVRATVPLATEVARPLLLTVATAALEDLQATSVVISWLFPSENVPEAANCCVTPTGMLGLAGVIDIETSLVVRPTLPLTPPPHVVRNTAKNPANSIIKDTLILFMRTPPGIGAAKLGRPTPDICLQGSS